MYQRKFSGKLVEDKLQLEELERIFEEECTWNGLENTTLPARRREIADILYKAFRTPVRERCFSLSEPWHFRRQVMLLLRASRHKIRIQEQGLAVEDEIIFGKEIKYAARIIRFTYDLCLAVQLLNAPHLAKQRRIVKPEDVVKKIPRARRRKTARNPQAREKFIKEVFLGQLV